MRRRKLRSTGMSKQRAAKFAPEQRDGFVEWDVKLVEGQVQVDIKPAGPWRLNPDDAYDLKSDIERVIDRAIGI